MLTLLWILTSVFPPAELERPELTAPEIHVSIAPSLYDRYQLLRRKTPGTFTCTASVSQAETRYGYLAAELVLQPGESDKVTKRQGEYSLDFAVTIKNQRADALVTVKRGEKLLTRQRSTVYLKTDEGVVPLR